MTPSALGIMSLIIAALNLVALVMMIHALASGQVNEDRRQYWEAVLKQVEKEANDELTQDL